MDSGVHGRPQGNTSMKTGKLTGRLVLLAVVGLAPLGCGIEALLANFASLGGDTAGGRGNTTVLFINNTPHRAIFTFGAYDNLDQDTELALISFSAGDNTVTLEGNSQSELRSVPCTRVYAIGTPGLITRVRANLDEGEFVEEALVRGVNFSSADVNDDEANDPTAGKAAPHEAFIGVDFECGSLVIYRFEVNDAGPEAFVIEQTVIPAESTR